MIKKIAKVVALGAVALASSMMTQEEARAGNNGACSWEFGYRTNNCLGMSTSITGVATSFNDYFSIRPISGSTLPHWGAARLVCHQIGVEQTAYSGYIDKNNWYRSISCPTQRPIVRYNMCGRFWSCA